MELDEVEEVFFMPSCGDESNVFGATAYFVKNELKQKMKRQLSIYLGMEYSNEEIKKFIQEKKLEEKYRVQYIPEIEIKIAELLSQFKVVARFAGRTEFGARSLGNRAILANPSDMKSFYMVNDQIKARDFWMPFAPSVLDRYAGIYFKNFDLNKNMPYYMIVTYDTTNEFQEKCRAAMHQGDKTARPQVVTKEMNPKYYKILEKFEKLTGIGAVLNTSLNIHGYPLVGTLDQALFTFENSGLKYVALENWLISKE
jgi:carbamoyltransferase